MTIPQTPVFEGITAEECRRIYECFGVRERRFKPEEQIYDFGSGGHSVGILVSGSAIVERVDRRGDRTILEHLLPGGVFGEMLMFQNVLGDSIDVSCEKSCSVWFFPQEKLENRCEKNCGHHNRMIENMFLEKAAAALGTDNFPLLVHMSDKDMDMQTFGPVTFTPTDEQTRYFDFNHAVYTDAASGKSIEISGLELTPFGAVWKVRYEGAEAFHTPGASQSGYEPYSLLEDKVCAESQLLFSDGSSFSTGGALSAPYTSGAVELHCEWGTAIDINDIQKIVLGDLVLWENK